MFLALLTVQSFLRGKILITPYTSVREVLSECHSIDICYIVYAACSYTLPSSFLLHPHVHLGFLVWGSMILSMK